MFLILDPKKEFNEAIRDFVNEIASETARDALKFMGDYIATSTNLAKIPLLSYFTVMSQALAVGMLFILLYKRILTFMKEDMTGENQPNWAQLIGDFALSASFVTATPWFISEMLIPINNEIVRFIAKAPVEWNLTSDGIQDILMPAGQSKTALYILIMFLIWAIGAICLSVSAMIRYAHLAIVVVLGPLLAATYQDDRSVIFSTYWKEVIAIVFTQSIQMVLYVFILATAAKGTFEMLLLSFGFMIVAITGPGVLKNYIHGTGTARGAIGGGRFVLYRMIGMVFRR